ncbi:MAG: multidrug efflux SMR transporter [Thermoleophilia bacterium]
MAWLVVIIAGLFEVVFATMLKLSNTFTRLWPTIGFAVAGTISFGLLAWALRTLPIGTAYAVWTGIGAAGTAALGIWVFDDPWGIARLSGIALIIVGVVVLNVSGTTA